MSILVNHFTSNHTETLVLYKGNTSRQGIY